MKKIKTILIGIFYLSLSLLGIGKVFAYQAPFGPTTAVTATDTPTSTVSVPASSNGVAVVNNPLPGSPLNIFHSIINNLAAVFFFIVGVALIGLIIYGGIVYMVDGGNEENAKKAKKIITSAIIGIAIMGLTGVIIKFIEAIFGISLGL